MTNLHTEHPSERKWQIQLFDNEHCVGTAVVIRDYLDDIMVYPPYRHHGYAQTLLNACREHGARVAIVVSDSGRRLFAAAGWQPRGGARFEFPTQD